VIKVQLGQVMAERKIKSFLKLEQESGITSITLRKLWFGEAKGIRFDTLNALCEALECQPGDLLVYVPDKKK
jgi:putative transcriptional regulator